ncbi:histidine kinase [Streptomyces sp. NBC_01255]|uniref:sensor histidine kinase n=1 Tax=Streptomyces sp. NBC_01255 TaxID=2903798 RepID=UPI002E37FEFC|nr:histidine kinase [Streptomyces sp. NBC_01255]
MRERLFDLGLWLLLCVPVLLRSDPNDGGSWPQVAVGVVVLGGCVAISRRWPLAPIAVTVAASLPATLELFTPSYSLALIAFGYLAGRRQEHTRSALWLFGAVAAVGLLLTRITATSLGQWFTLLLALALAIVAPWLIGRYVRQYDRLVHSGWELADRMEREQAAVADRERLRERSRIAGDMHDSLGHDLALIAVRAGALEVDPALGPDQQHAAGELRRAAADATARLRDVIGVLRQPDEDPAPTAPGGAPVEELVSHARASGLAVALTVTGKGHEPDGMAGWALHRVVQEALTNAAKHAPGGAVDVRVEAAPERVTVNVESGPGAAGSPLASGGTGLVGLDERVRLAGGVLTHGPTPDGGFAVRATLPRRTPAGPPTSSPAAPTSARELDRVRRQVRKGLAQAIWIPLALLAALGLLMAGVALWTQHQSYLEPDDYDHMRIGQTLTAITDAEDLPDHPLDGPPKGVPTEPPGMDECRYYRSTLLAAVPVYRLCFVDGHLADKAEVR